MTEAGGEPLCGVEWSDPIPGGSQYCLFVLEETDDGWACPVHGLQSVPEYEGETRGEPEPTEQATLGGGPA